MNPSMHLVCACIARRVGIVDDGLVGHEQSDDVGQLSGMREVDGVSRSVDDDEDRRGAPADLATSWMRAGPGNNGSRLPANDQRRHVQGKQPVQRRILGERPEHSECARNAESQIVRDRHAQQPDRFPDTVVAELPYRPRQRLIV